MFTNNKDEISNISKYFALFWSLDNNTNVIEYARQVPQDSLNPRNSYVNYPYAILIRYYGIFFKNISSYDFPSPRF